MQRISLLAVAIAIAVAAPFLFLNAAEYLPQDPQNAGNVVVGGPQEYRNLYVAGGSVVINKQIFGDLFAAGGSVNVAGPVEKDLFAVGGNVTVSSAVGEDARLAGGNLVINAPVNGDLLLAGGTVSISEGALISGDLWAAGGVINISSAVAGDAKLAGGEIFVNGPIAGTLEVWAQEKLVFGPQSRVLGAIKYSGPREAVVQEGAEVGPIEFTYAKAKQFPAAKALGAFFFLKLAALLTAGLIVLTLFGKTSLAVVSSTHNQFLANLGIGVVGMLAIPIAAVLFMATVIGAYAGAILALWFGAAALMGGIFGVMFIGALAEKWARRKQAIELTWRTVVWGVAAGGLLSLIPFVGWLIIFVLYLASFGGLLRTVKERLEV